MAASSWRSTVNKLSEIGRCHQIEQFLIHLWTALMRINVFHAMHILILSLTDHQPKRNRRGLCLHRSGGYSFIVDHWHCSKSTVAELKPKNTIPKALTSYRWEPDVSHAVNRQPLLFSIHSLQRTTGSSLILQSKSGWANIANWAIGPLGYYTNEKHGWYACVCEEHVTWGWRLAAVFWRCRSLVDIAQTWHTRSQHKGTAPNTCSPIHRSNVA